MFKASELVEFAQKMVGMPYWYGTCVFRCTTSLLKSKSKQYPKHYTSARMSKYRTAVKNKKVCADCVGLIKGFFWTNGGEGVEEYIDGGKNYTVKYGSNGCPDKSANGMLSWCKAKGCEYGKIDTLAEVPGVLLFSSGHVGVYIGDGYAVEARGFNYGIVKTKVKDRTWSDWAYLPESLLEYDTVKVAEVEMEEPVVETSSEYTVHGIIPDVSVYQGNIDMDKFCAGNDFAIFRARVNGKNDTKFKQWAKELNERDFPFAVYDYCCLKSDKDAIAQANGMFELCSPYAPRIYYLDTEKLATGVTYKKECGYIETYVNRLRELGVKCIGQYTSDYLWRTKYKGLNDIFDTLWIANWGKNNGSPDGITLKSATLTDKVDLHQYTSFGYTKVAGAPGIEHRVDLNRLTGTKPLSWFTGRTYE